MDITKIKIIRSIEQDFIKMIEQERQNGAEIEVIRVTNLEPEDTSSSGDSKRTKSEPSEPRNDDRQQLVLDDWRLHLLHSINIINNKKKTKQSLLRYFLNINIIIPWVPTSIDRIPKHDFLKIKSDSFDVIHVKMVKTRQINLF